jgi:outer membrane protein
MKKTPRISVASTLVTAVIFLAAPAATLAQQASQRDASGKDWKVSLGAGVLYHPEYEGSDEYDFDPLPLLMVSYRDLVFLRGATLGANALTWQGPRDGDKLQIGPLIRYQPGRDEDDSDDLHGMGDIDGGIELGGFITYGIGAWAAGLTILQDVSGSHDGFTAKLSASHRHAFSPKMRLRSELSTTWADESYMETFFGVTAAQSARSGMRAYQPGSGIKDVGVSFDLDYSLTDHWVLTGRLGYKRMLGDAADSPLVEDRGSDSQFITGLFLSYRF